MALLLGCEAEQPKECGLDSIVGGRLLLGVRLRLFGLGRRFLGGLDDLQIAAAEVLFLLQAVPPVFFERNAVFVGGDGEGRSEEFRLKELLSCLRLVSGVRTLLCEKRCLSKPLPHSHFPNDL